jgi:multiple sugar transport system ATP-binding protein
MVGVPSRDRDIAMVFQNYALYPSKTVAENMGFALKMQGVPKEERASRVRDAAKLLDLEEFLDRKPRNLSGGQRQRVAMGRAIVREPKVFCMDEPLSNLDAQLRVQTRTQIAELQRRLKVTTVYVTHDQVEAMTMGDRVAVMRLGRLQQFASPTELYDHPANVFVAGFIGSPAMNRLDGSLAPGHIQVGEISIRPPDAMLQAAQGHGKLVVGIRPEHLSIAGSGPASGGGEFTLEVELVEDLGSDSYIYGHLAGDKDSKIIVRAGRDHPRPGEVIKVGIDAERLHLFDKVTGERVGE